LSRPAVLPAPAWALKILLGEMSRMLLGGQRALPKAATDLGFKFKFPMLADALKAVI